MDIKPIRPVQKPDLPDIASSPSLQPTPPQPIATQQTGLKVKSAKWSLKRWIVTSSSVFVALLIIAATSFWFWYQHELSAVGTNTNEHVTVTIAAGMNPAAIGDLLQEKKVIRSSFAFALYTRSHGLRGSLQAGSYKLSPSETTPKVIEHLTNGTVDTFELTFYPGATLVDNTTKAVEKKQDVTSVLHSAGFSDDDIAAALAKTYDNPIFADKPASADLEGYVYGQTYQFNSDATPEQILERTFDEMYKVVKDNDLIAKFKSHGLNLYQGITLASIVQREVSNVSDRKQVAQVFYTRLSDGMMLGSDVTFIYAAQKLGVEPISTLDSPYNTRINTGLPPGPIASPGESALLAVGSPADGDYVYFVAGEDGKTYFARTLAEHEKNVADHCGVECTKP